jgi:hypothetical protein
MIANIGYKDKYYVAWAAGSTGYWASDDTDAGDLGLSMNGRIYWDGDLQEELQDHTNIQKWNDAAGKMDTIFTGDGNSINGTKGNINFQADMFGDWREEFACYKVIDSVTETIPYTVQTAVGEAQVEATRTTSKYALRIYTTTDPTDYNFSTFMHDDLYRIGVATYNVAYNQPPHISFYLSDNPNLSQKYDTQPTPNVKLVANNYTEAAFDPSSVSGTAAPAAPATTPSTGASTITMQIDNATMNVGGTDNVIDVPPMIINDRTMVPLRAIFEALGADVQWDGDTRTITGTKGDTTITMQIDSLTMTKNGAESALDTPPQIVSDRTLVPVRAIAESFDCQVDWDGDTRTVTISVN